MQDKTTSQIYERIVNLFNTLKSPVSLYQIYEFCKKVDNLSLFQIRGSLKWLFDNGFLAWKGNGHIIPLKEVKTTNEDIS